MAPPLPRKLGRYRIERVIARAGGGGVVYAAYDSATGRTVALKHLPAPEGFADKARFEREMELARRLRHPNIVEVFEAVQLEDGDRLIAMELIDGKDLAMRTVEGPLLPTRIATIVEALGSALSYAHREGVVHRDVKPSNAMLAEDGWVLLMDFGLARHTGDATVTATAQRVGTFAYIAPEQALGRRVSPKTDAYALTTTLFTLLTRRLPFSRETNEALLYAHIHEPPPRPSAYRSDLAPFDVVVAKGMAKSIDKRLSVDELVVAVRKAAVAWATEELPARDRKAAPRPFAWRRAGIALRRPARESSVMLERPRRRQIEAVVAAIAEHRLPVGMGTVFIFTLAIILILRSMAA